MLFLLFRPSSAELWAENGTRQPGICQDDIPAHCASLDWDYRDIVLMTVVDRSHAAV